MLSKNGRVVQPEVSDLLTSGYLNNHNISNCISQCL